MIQGLDSMNPPSAAQARAAKAGGYSKWSGYLATQPNVGLARAWSQAEFENARLCGSQPIAYCSGWDDPQALKALAVAWNVLPCLDNEGGIRPDGAWAQPWLDAAGAGVYGNAPVHRLRAAFHVLAAYPTTGDPSGASWNYGTRPAGPCGWQWAGTHTAYGVGVDSTWFDDWFGGLHGGGGYTLGTVGDLDEKWLTDVGTRVARDTVSGAGPTTADLLAAIKAVPAIFTGAAADLTPVLKAVAAIDLKVDAIQAKLAKDLA